MVREVLQLYSGRFNLYYDIFPCIIRTDSLLRFHENGKKKTQDGST